MMIQKSIENGNANIITVTRELFRDPKALFYRCKKNDTLLHYACYFDQPSLVDAFILLGLHPDTRNDDGVVGLHYACQAGNVDVIRMLLRHGADINAGNLYGTTPLHFATLHGNKEASRVMLENGADPGARNIFKQLAGTQEDLERVWSRFFWLLEC